MNYDTVLAMTEQELVEAIGETEFFKLARFSDSLAEAIIAHGFGAPIPPTMIPLMRIYLLAEAE